MKFNVFEYNRAHGKHPRGKRTWYFSPGDGAGHIYPEYGFAVEMTYTQAKTWAKDHFSGYMEVYVLP